MTRVVVVYPEMINGDDFNEAHRKRICLAVEGHLDKLGLYGEVHVSPSLDMTHGWPANEPSSFLFYLKYGHNGENHLNVAVLTQGVKLYFLIDPDLGPNTMENSHLG